MNPDDIEALGLMPDDDDLGLMPDIDGSDAVPAGYVETGERTVVRELPAYDVMADTFAPGSGSVYEQRTIDKDPRHRAHLRGTQVAADQRTIPERLRDEAPQMALDVAAQASGPLGWLATSPALPQIAGRDPVTPETLRRAARTMREGAGGGLGTVDAALRTVMPTAAAEDPTAPDRRPGAVWRGLGQGVMFGAADEIGAGLDQVLPARPWLGEQPVRIPGPEDSYAGRRDALRAEYAQSADQAPVGDILGQLAGSAPLAILPGGQQTVAGRIGAQAGYGAGAGALRGLGMSEEDSIGGWLGDTVEGAAIEGALGAAGAGLGEAIPAGLRWAAEGARSRAPQSRLEATGIWGGGAMRRAAESRPGGAEQLADEVRRLGIGLGEQSGQSRHLDEFFLGRSPRSTRALADAAEVRLAAEARMDEVVREMDSAASYGGHVDLSDVAEEMERVALEYERIPVGGAEVARTLRERIIEPLRGQGRMTFSEAHVQRQVLDDMIRTWSGEANLSTAGGRLRSARRALSRAMDEAAERVDEGMREAWRQANRDYSTARFVEQYGRGAERLNIQGGLGGSAAAAVGTALHGPGHVVQDVINREAMQWQRVNWPGYRTRLLEAAARLGDPRLGRYADVLRAAFERGGPPAAAAAHYVLGRTRPDYREALEATREDMNRGSEEHPTGTRVPFEHEENDDDHDSR